MFNNDVDISEYINNIPEEEEEGEIDIEIGRAQGYYLLIATSIGWGIIVGIFLYIRLLLN